MSYIAGLDAVVVGRPVDGDAGGQIVLPDQLAREHDGLKNRRVLDIGQVVS